MAVSDKGGRLVFFLNEDSQNLDVALEIEAAFSIDNSFPAARNLTEKLLEILPRLQASERRTQWINALTDIQFSAEAEYKDSWTLLAETKSRGNPLGGHYEYALAAYILQTTSFPDLDKIDFGIKCLFISVLLQKPIRHGLGEVAKAFRREICVSVENYHLVKLLPEIINQSPADYFKELEQAASELESYNSSDWIKRIKKLITRNNKSEIQERELINTIGFQAGKKETSGSNEQDGSRHKLVSRLLNTKGRQTAEPPVVIDFVTIEDGADDSAVELETELKLTNFWLRRHHKLVPADYGRLNRVERKRLVEFLRHNIKSDNKKDRNAAGLMSLLFVTGERLETLIKLEIGAEGVFGQNGIYRRAVRIVDDAWEATEEQRDKLDECNSELVLELPSFLAGYINELISAMRNITTLGEALGMSYEQAKELVQTALIKVRENGLYDRITLDRLSTALAIETTLMFDDPVITFQLSSKQNHAAPMLNYYVSHKIDTLEKCYKQLVYEMMNV